MRASKVEDQKILDVKNSILELIKGHEYTLIGFTDVDNFCVQTVDGKTVRFEQEHVRLLRLLRSASAA